MTVAAGSAATLRWKKQAAKGTYNASGGQILRRITGKLSYDRTKIENNQIRSDKQMAMPRLGLGTVKLPYQDIITPGTHSAFYASVLLGAYATAATTGAQTNITAAVTTAPAGTFTRATGTFITDGFRVGQVVRWAGWTTGATANNAHNFRITALSALVMTCEPLDGVALVAKAAGDSVTCTLVGKQVSTPSSGHVDDWYTFEDWQSDISQSEQSFDSRIESFNLKIAPNAQPTIDINVKGLVFTQETSAYFASPTAEASTDVSSAVNSKLILDGVAIATITDMSINASVELDMPAVVGAAVYPMLASKQVKAEGSITVLWEDQALMTKYLNETDLTISAILPNSNLPASDFVGYTIPRVRLFTAEKSDGLEAKTKTYTWSAGENAAAVAGTIASTIAVQDSLAT